MTRERFDKARDILSKIADINYLLNLLNNALDKNAILSLRDADNEQVLNSIYTSDIEEPLTLMKECVTAYYEELENKFAVL